jgi:hypothetical protein
MAKAVTGSWSIRSAAGSHAATFLRTHRCRTRVDRLQDVETHHATCHSFQKQQKVTHLPQEVTTQGRIQRAHKFFGTPHVMRHYSNNSIPIIHAECVHELLVALDIVVTEGFVLIVLLAAKLYEISK